MTIGIGTLTIGIRNDDRRGAAQRGGWREVAGNIATGILVVLLGGVATETRGAETKNDPDFATVNPSRAVDSQRADRRRWDADRYVERQSAWEESIREVMSIDGHSAAGPGMPSTASDLRRFGPEGAARYRAAERWRTLGLTDGASSDVLRMLTSSQPDVRVTVALLDAGEFDALVRWHVSAGEEIAGSRRTHAATLIRQHFPTVVAIASLRPQGPAALERLFQDIRLFDGGEPSDDPVTTPADSADPREASNEPGLAAALRRRDVAASIEQYLKAAFASLPDDDAAGSSADRPDAADLRAACRAASAAEALAIRLSDEEAARVRDQIDVWQGRVELALAPEEDTGTTSPPVALMDELRSIVATNTRFRKFLRGDWAWLHDTWNEGLPDESDRNGPDRFANPIEFGEVVRRWRPGCEWDAHLDRTRPPTLAAGDDYWRLELAYDFSEGSSLDESTADWLSERLRCDIAIGRQDRARRAIRFLLNSAEAASARSNRGRKADRTPAMDETSRQKLDPVRAAIAAALTGHVDWLLSPMVLADDDLRAQVPRLAAAGMNGATANAIDWLSRHFASAEKLSESAALRLAVLCFAGRASDAMADPGRLNRLVAAAATAASEKTEDRVTELLRRRGHQPDLLTAVDWAAVAGMLRGLGVNELGMVESAAEEDEISAFVDAVRQATLQGGINNSAAGRWRDVLSLASLSNGSPVEADVIEAILRTALNDESEANRYELDGGRTIDNGGTGETEVRATDAVSLLLRDPLASRRLRTIRQALTIAADRPSRAVIERALSSTLMETAVNDLTSPEMSSDVLLATLRLDDSSTEVAVGFEMDRLLVAAADFPPMHWVTLLRHTESIAIREAVAADRMAEARRRLVRFLNLSPIDITFLEPLIGPIEAAGGDAILQEVMRIVLDAASRHHRRCPLDVGTANNVAWAAALADEVGATTVGLSRAACDADPTSAIYRDTLAEILFRQGESRQAARLEQACIVDDPGQYHLHRQIERFTGPSLNPTPP